jgi:hypothetical protein
MRMERIQTLVTEIGMLQQNVRGEVVSRLNIHENARSPVA